MLGSWRVLTQVRILKWHVVLLLLLLHVRPRLRDLFTHKPHLLAYLRSALSLDHKLILSQIDAVFLHWTVSKQLVERLPNKARLPISDLNDPVHLLFLLRSRSKLHFFSNLLNSKRVEHVLCK